MPATPETQPRPVWRTVLAFDFGRARIGVAVGEALTGTARPLRTLATRNQRPDWDTIARLLEEWRPDGLVVGVPRHADDSANALTEAALRFARQLQGRFNRPVATIDERLSSWDAGQRRADRGIKSGRRQDAALDATAAAVILETWFHHLRSAETCAMPSS